MKDEKRFFRLILIFVSLGFAACQSAPTNSVQNANSSVSPNISAANVEAANAKNSDSAVQTAKGATHEHVAPHGGTLVAFGEEFAHLELVLDASNGQLTAYALDGEAEKSVPLAQAEIEIAIEKPRKFTVKLAAQENALTGEKIGSTSEFRASSDELKNLTQFDARIKSITIRGKRFNDTHFNFPKGNEGEHQH